MCFCFIWLVFRLRKFNLFDSLFFVSLQIKEHFHKSFLVRFALHVGHTKSDNNSARIGIESVCLNFQKKVLATKLFLNH